MKQARRFNGIRTYFAADRAKALAATSAFLMLTLLLVFGVIRLFSAFVSRELNDESTQRTATPSATASPAATPEARQAGSSAVRFPSAPPDIAATPDPEDELPPASAPAPSASPVLSQAAPETAARGKASFTRRRMDVVLMGLDRSGALDSLALLAMREDRCTLIFLPKNTLDGTGAPISRLRDEQDVITALGSILPVDFHHYISFQMDALSRCVDAAGGISVAGVDMDGAAAAAFVAPDGLDELIRVTNLQSLALSCLQKAPQFGFLRLAAIKAAAAGKVRSSLSIEQSVTLFAAIRALEGGAFSAILLPVDSTQANGARCYCADIELTDQLAGKYFLPG